MFLFIEIANIFQGCIIKESRQLRGINILNSKFCRMGVEDGSSRLGILLESDRYSMGGIFRIGRIIKVVIKTGLHTIPQCKCSRHFCS